jgi:hypothetical protein
MSCPAMHTNVRDQHAIENWCPNRNAWSQASNSTLVKRLVSWLGRLVRQAQNTGRLQAQQGARGRNRLTGTLWVREPT